MKAFQKDSLNFHSVFPHPLKCDKSLVFWCKMMADINATLEPGSLRSGVQGEWSDTTRSISPCTQITDYTECQSLFPVVRIRSPPPPPPFGSTRSISPCTQITGYIECQDLFPIVRIRPPHPLTLKGMLLLPPLDPKGGDRLAWGGEGGGGGPNFDEGKDTLVLYVYYNPSTTQIHHRDKFWICFMCG